MAESKHTARDYEKATPEQQTKIDRLEAEKAELLEACECAASDLRGIMPTELVKRFGATRIKLANALDNIKPKGVQ